MGVFTRETVEWRISEGFGRGRIMWLAARTGCNTMLVSCRFPRRVHGKAGQLEMGDFEERVWISHIDVVCIGTAITPLIIDIVPHYHPKFPPPMPQYVFDTCLPHSSSAPNLSHGAPPMWSVCEQSHDQIDQFFSVEFESEFPFRP